jgi:hypothetical protein
MLIGELTWIYTSGGGTANLNFIPHLRDSDAARLWFEDGSRLERTHQQLLLRWHARGHRIRQLKTLVWNPAGAGGTNWNTTTSNWLDGAIPQVFRFRLCEIRQCRRRHGNVDPAGVTPGGVEISHTSGTLPLHQRIDQR